MSAINTIKKELEKSYKKVASQNTKAVNEYLAALNDNYNKQITAYKQQIEAKKAAVPSSYKDDYDLNSINRLINERKLNERMAALGLTNSGANQTLKMGLDIAKNNADNIVTMQKNKELLALDNDYNAKFNSLEADLQNKRTAALKSLNDRNASLINSLTAKYNDAIKSINTSTTSGSSGKLLTVYNKLIDMNSPSQQRFYIDLVCDGGVITEDEAARLKKKLHLD